MPSVPSAKDNGGLAHVCPHAAKMMLLKGEGNGMAEAILNADAKSKLPPLINSGGGDLKMMGLNGDSTNGHHTSSSNGHHANGESNGVAKHHKDGDTENGVEEEEEEEAESPLERKWIRPDLASRCTWRLGGPNIGSPHTHPER